MRRITSFRWQTPAPTSVDEELVLFDDGTTWLVVRGPRREDATIGSFVDRPTDDESGQLTAAGVGPHTVDLRTPLDPARADLLALAQGVADGCRASPRAIVTFHAHLPAIEADGSPSITLLAIAGGTDPVEFELDPGPSSIHYLDSSGQPMSWQVLPTPQTGFVTPDAEGLGGLHRAALMRPGAYGAITFPSARPEGAASAAILVAGWLRDALPDAPNPERFQVRTALAPVPT
jgi:hypothetical protein